MAKDSKNRIGREFDIDNGVITFTGAGKQCQLMVAQIVGEEAYAALSPVGKAMLLHGGSQKCGDQAAIGRDADTGASASPEVRFAAVMDEVERLNEGGDWTTKSAGKPALNRAALFEAVAEVRKVEASVVAQRFQDRPDEVLKAFLTHGDIAAAYARRTARNTAMADSLLAELA